MYLNIIRPAGEYKDLPVVIWFHGGGNTLGSGIDQRYNQTFMVQNSVKIGKPIIAIAVDYRLYAWGWMSSLELQGSGNLNLGLRDQRMAMHWVQENIAAFGGMNERAPGSDDNG